MRNVGILVLIVFALSQLAQAEAYQDRFVWIFGWDLSNDADVSAIAKVLDTAAGHGINGAVVSFDLDALCKKSPDYFRRLEEVRRACDGRRIELIPSVFSVGYGGGALAHNRYLAEGLPVENAPFLVSGREARIVPDVTARLANGGFEEATGNKLASFNFHDQPGVVSFVDGQVKHSGRSSLRMENFTANPHGHGRVMQQVRLVPNRCYRVSLWVKTENLEPAQSFQILSLANDREIAPRNFNLPATTDWRKLTMIVNSLDLKELKLYAGVWGAKSGKFWLDDWSIEEVGPLNVLRRPGTPVIVRSEDGAVTYAENQDYAPLVDPNYSPYRVEHEAPALRILPGGAIRDGQKLRVSWYHSQLLYDSQITICMAEPELYEIYDHEARLLAERLRPRRVLLSMDEVRMGGTCVACRGKNMAELLGQCITRQVQILRKHMPGVQIYIWSDMLDPHHNARADYYLVRGDFTGSWNHVPKDLVIAVWGREPREKNLGFFSEQGFQTLAACYYDADDLSDVQGWVNLAKRTRNVRGFMYTPWEKKYELLGAFGDMIGGQR